MGFRHLFQVLPAEEAYAPGIIICPAAFKAFFHAVIRTLEWKILVRAKGLEPPRSELHMDLNHTRLPVPPRPHHRKVDIYQRELYYK